MDFHRPPNSALQELLGNLNPFGKKSSEGGRSGPESCMLPTLDVTPGPPAGNGGRLPPEGVPSLFVASEFWGAFCPTAVLLVAFHMIVFAYYFFDLL